MSMHLKVRHAQETREQGRPTKQDPVEERPVDPTREICKFCKKNLTKSNMSIHLKVRHAQETTRQGRPMN